MEIFESCDAEASYTTFERAGRIRRGGFIMIKDRPCKVFDVSLNAPGKHGHAKCHFVGQDMITGDKMETVIPSGHNADVPTISKKDYLVMYPEYVQSGAHVSLMDILDYTTRQDLRLPDASSSNKHSAELYARIHAMCANSKDKDVVCVVLKVCGVEIISDVKQVATTAAAA